MSRLKIISEAQAARFLDLPPEIRNLIYGFTIQMDRESMKDPGLELCFDESDGYFRGAWDMRFHTDLSTYKPDADNALLWNSASLSLARTCRDAYTEMLPAIYETFLRLEINIDTEDYDDFIMDHSAAMLGSLHQRLRTDLVRRVDLSIQLNYIGDVFQTVMRSLYWGRFLNQFIFVLHSDEDLHDSRDMADAVKVCAAIWQTVSMRAPVKILTYEEWINDCYYWDESEVLLPLLVAEDQRQTRLGVPHPYKQRKLLVDD